MDQMPDVAQMKQPVVPFRNMAVLAVASLILSRLPVGNFIFTIPLLLVSRQIGSRKKTAAVYAVVLALIFAWALYDSYDSRSKTFSIGLLVLTTSIPLAMGITSAVWSLMSYSRIRYRTRFATCSVVMIAMITVLLVWLSRGSKAVLELEQQISETFTTLFSNSFNMDSASFIGLTLLICQYALVPASLIIMGFPILISESMIHRDRKWQYEVGTWSIPNDFVWVFLGAFFAAIIGRVLTFPVLLDVILWNTALITCIAYGIQGYAILVFWIRKKTDLFPAHKLVIYLVILGIIPGVNAVVMAGLPLLGVLETWITMRKPNKENSYEDHFESGRT